jgi:hypothetical protein
MRYNKLVLKNMSEEDKNNILSSVFLNKKYDLLNGVDLTTEDGKNKFIESIIDGKNPFNNTKDEDIDWINKNITTSTPWQKIVEESSDEAVGQKIDIKSDSPFENYLLNVAYSKKIKEFQVEIFLPVDEISDRMLNEYVNNTSAKKSISTAVKFFQRMSSDIFTECQSCGKDNTVPWKSCQHCGADNSID